VLQTDSLEAADAGVIHRCQTNRERKVEEVEEFDKLDHWKEKRRKSQQPARNVVETEISEEQVAEEAFLKECEERENLLRSRQS